MPDVSILTDLSKPVTILDHTYWVGWNAEKQVAEVIRDGKFVVGFPCEFRAHEYIMGLASLDQTKDMEAWRRINEQETTS